MKFIINKSSYPYKGKILDLRVDEIILPNGRKAHREIVEHRGIVAIVPFINQDTVILIRQHRHPIEEDILEIPAGLLELDEDAYECAARELIEETGYKASNLEKLLDYYPAPEYSNQKTYIFKATCSEYVGVKPDEEEFIDVETVDLQKMNELIINGEIKDSKSIIGLLLAKKEAK